jgi:hypothetical protein
VAVLGTDPTKSLAKLPPSKCSEKVNTGKKTLMMQVCIEATKRGKEREIVNQFQS